MLVEPNNFQVLNSSKDIAGNQPVTAPENPSLGSANENKLPIYAHALDFTEGEQEVFYVGSEDFNIYQCNKGQEGLVSRALKGHDAPVTSVHVHPGVAQSEKHGEMAELLISSSLDWTVKLWQPNSRTEPLFTFESA